MSISSIKNLGLRGSKSKIVENAIDDEIYIGGTFFTSDGLDYECVDGFFSVDKNGTFDKALSSQPYGFSSNVPGIVYKCIQQPDGKIIFGGSFASYRNPTGTFLGVPTANLFRLNADYSLDTTFFSYTVSGFSAVSGEVFDIALQPDGKIVVVGNFNGANGFGGIGTNRIARLNSNSTIDTTFNVGTGFGTTTNNPVRVVKVLSDGKILVGTNYTTYNGITVTRLLRLNSDASVDGTFNIGTGPSSTVTCIEFQSDGKMLVGGYFTTFNGVTVNRLVRLNTDLTIDNTFNIGSGFGSDVETIAIQSDGKILVGGNFTSFNGITTNRLVRLNSDGSRDSTFNIGSGFNDRVRKINLEIDGKILVGGLYSTYRGSIFNRIIGLTYTGEVDQTFDVGFGITLQSVGNSSYGVYDILKLNTDKILITGGVFSAYKGNSYNRKLLKLNNNMEVDEDFQQTFVSFYSPSAGSINDIKIQSDGNILIAADSTSFSLVRVYPDGKRDGGFSASPNSGIFSVDIYSDNKVIIGGRFTTLNSISSNRIGRLNSDGSRDSTFNVGSGSNSTVNVVKLIDDKILAGGDFTQYSGSTSNYIVRINSDGSIDNTFNIGSGFNNNVETIAIQSDGKLLVGGNFTSYNGVSINRLVRLNSDGTIDNTFNVGTGAGSTIWSIYIQPDNKILVGGSFTTFNTIRTNYIIRLFNNGTIDNSFQLTTDSTAGEGIYSIAMTSDNRILVGGWIRGLGGKVRDGLIVLDSNGLITNSKFNAAPLFSSSTSRSNSTNSINIITVKK
jgi:uncharacterized delta-60 repeat protein